MDIGPVDNAKPPSDKGEGAKRETVRNNERSSEQKDELSISEKAQQLQEESKKTDGGIEQERLREIKGRIDRGYYSRPKIADKIAEKLLGEETVEVDFLRAKYPVFFEGIPDGDSEQEATTEEPEESE